MEPKTASLPSISDLFNETMTFYKAAWQKFAPITLIMSAATILSTLLVTFGVDKSSGLHSLLGLVGIVLSIWGSVAVLYALRRYVEGDHTLNVSEIYKGAVPFIVPVILTGILVGAMVIGGLILLVIPGIIIMVWAFATNFIVMFENIKFFDAFKRSKDLVSGHWLDVFVRLVVLFIAVIIVSAITSIIPIIGSIVSAVVIVPFSLYYTYLLYNSLRQQHSLAQEHTA